MTGILWMVFLVLLVLWLVGFAVNGERSYGFVAGRNRSAIDQRHRLSKSSPLSCPLKLTKTKEGD